MTKNLLVINRKFFDSINNEKNLLIIGNYGFQNADSFLMGICKKLNEEYDFTNLTGYRFQEQEEAKEFSMFSAFIDGNVSPFKKVVLAFSPIETKLGNTNIVQEVMPMICNQMERNINFLLDKDIKRIFVLTSRFNQKNEISKDYNTLQMNVNSLNTLNFDVINMFTVKHLSYDSKFNSLTEYLEMARYLQTSNLANDQFEYLVLDETKKILYGKCLKSQIKGQWQKSFVFKFFTAIFSGREEYKYDIEGVLVHNIIDNQIQNLQKFVNYVNNNKVDFTLSFIAPQDDVIEANDEVIDFDDINRLPQQGVNKLGRQRFKTQRKIRDNVLKDYDYLCDCHDLKHFYFESSDSYNNYVEGHHVIPMNRQDEYWSDHNINLDVSSNIIPLCPNCHSQIHLGSRRARLDILSEIFVRDEFKLKRVDKNLTLTKLCSFYNIALSSEEESYILSNAKLRVAKKRENKL